MVDAARFLKAERVTETGIMLQRPTQHFRVILNLARATGALTTTLVGLAGCAWFGSSAYERPITERTIPASSLDLRPTQDPIDNATGQFTSATNGAELKNRDGASPWITRFANTSASMRASQPPDRRGAGDNAPRLSEVDPVADRPETSRSDISRSQARAPATAHAEKATPAGASRVAFAPPQPPAAPRPARSPESTPPLNLSQVTFASEGADFDPCVSRDGATIVYASTQHRDTADIYVKPTDGRVVTQLTNDPANDVMPTISPDGQHIAFASDRTGNWDIYVMPIGGGRAVQVTADAVDELHPSWSPDGKSLVFCRLGTMSARWEMWVIDTSNQAVSNFIGYGLFPTWCPVSGTGASLGAAGASGATDKILFQLGRERGERSFAVWTVDYKDGRTGNATEIASSGEAAFINPAWSPDGSKIVYVSVPNASDWDGEARRRPDSAELWMLNTDGSGKVNLTGSTAIALMPFWGPQERLYFVANRGSADNIWSIDLEPAIRAASLNNPAAGSRTALKSADSPKPVKPVEPAVEQPETEVADAPEEK